MSNLLECVAEKAFKRGYKRGYERGKETGFRQGITLGMGLAAVAATQGKKVAMELYNKIEEEVLKKREKK